jgi:hypothetical protein
MSTLSQLITICECFQQMQFDDEVTIARICGVLGLIDG